jgi:hypothetical protein
MIRFFISSFLVFALLAPASAVDVYVVAGQSNGWRLSHLGEGGPGTGPKVHYFGMNCISEPEVATLKTLKTLSTQTMGSGLASSLVAQAGGRDIVFVQYSRCGASIMHRAKNSWWPGENPAAGKRFDEGVFASFEKYLASARTQVERDLGEKWEVKGLFWHQGETDQSADKTAFERDLRNVFARLRGLLGADVPIVAAHIRDLGPGQRGINAVLDKLAAEDSRMATVNLDGAAYERDREGAPNVHIALKGCELVGRRMAAAMAGLRIASDVKAAGGKINIGPDAAIAIDLYNGNNPLKGKGGKNEAVTDAWLAKLAPLTSLRRLDLANCAVTDAGMTHLAGLTSLEDLNLTLTPVTDAGLAHLGQLTALRSFGLASTKCTGSGFAHLKALKKLENVNFHFTPLNDDGLKAISEVGISGRLWFAHTKFTDPGARNLAALRELKTCGIGSADKSSSGEAVAALVGLPHLEDLALLDNQATPAGIAHAAKITTLRKLDVSYAPTAEDASLRQIAALPNLAELKFGGAAQVTDDGLLALADCKALKKLTLSGLKKTTADGIERLRKKRPDLEIAAK